MSRNATQKWEFFRAVRDGDTATVRRMLYDNNRLLNIVSDDDMRPLFIAAENGNLEMVRFLIEAGADINIQDEDGWAPLSGATSRGHIEVVRLLIDAGAEVNIQEGRGDTSVNIAAKNGYIQIVRLLIGAGADLNIEHDGGWPPLTGAASNGHLQVVQLLINAGANINPEGDDHSPFFAAVSNNRVEIARLLLENGADINKKVNIFGIRPLTALSMAMTNQRAMEMRGMTDDIAKANEIINMIRNHILFKDAKQAILIAEEKDITRDESFLVFKEFVKRDMEDAGDSNFDVDNKNIHTKLKNYFKTVEAQRAPSSRIAVVAARQRAAERAAERAERASSSTTGGSRSRTKSGKRKSKRSQRRPPNAVCTRAQKLGIRLTVKRNNKRVYKSEEVLRTQIKNAINRQNRKK